MSKLEESYINYFYKNMIKYQDRFSYVANLRNNTAIDFLAASIANKFDDNPGAKLEEELMYEFYSNLHNQYINQLALGIIYRTNKFNLKEDSK